MITMLQYSPIGFVKGGGCNDGGGCLVRDGSGVRQGCSGQG